MPSLLRLTLGILNLSGGSQFRHLKIQEEGIIILSLNLGNISLQKQAAANPWASKDRAENLIKICRFREEKKKPQPTSVFNIGVVMMLGSFPEVQFPRRQVSTATLYVPLTEVEQGRYSTQHNLSFLKTLPITTPKVTFHKTEILRYFISLVKWFYEILTDQAHILHHSVYLQKLFLPEVSLLVMGYWRRAGRQRGRSASAGGTPSSPGHSATQKKNL